MTIYILEDDEIQLIYFTSIIEKNPAYHIIGKQMEASLAVTEIEHLKPDVLILDIELNNSNGFELFKTLPFKPLLILCTSHLEYALEAFEQNAIDYLVKPASPEKIYNALQKAEAIRALQRSSSDQREIQYQQDAVFIKDGNKYVKLFLQQILYIESLGDFSEFHIQHQSKKIALVSLKQLEEQLPKSYFLRISRNTMINVQHVESANTQEIVIHGQTLHIGKTYADRILQKILDKQLVIKRNT